jgi:tryptophan-rich sensory protein
MTAGHAILWTLAACVLSAALEGAFAGSGVKEHFARLRFPSYSLPLWSWYVVGVLYYVIFAALLYRLFRHEGDEGLRRTALALTLAMMCVNALWNWIFFRSKNLFLSFVVFFPYNLLAVALLIALTTMDGIAAGLLVPYAVYLVYANVWGYGVWKVNRPSG